MSDLLDRIIDRLPTPVEILDDPADPDFEARSVMSGYGAVAVSDDTWLRERAQRYLAGLPHLRHPGHANQKVHGHAGGHEGPRKALRDAKTIDEINRVVAKEAKRITGRNVGVNFAGHDPQIAREHGEGVLRNMERYPKTPVGRIESYGEGSGRDSTFGPNDRNTLAYNTEGVARDRTDKISFNNYYASDPDFYRTQLSKAEAGGSMPRGVGTPIGVATHEFGHSVARHVDAEVAAGEIAAFGKKQAGHETAREYIRAEIGEYATANHKELAADAFADVQINAEHASSLSREIVSSINARYEATYGEAPK